MDQSGSRLRSALQTAAGLLQGLRGEHRFSAPLGATASQEYLDLVRDNTLISEHPLVTIHPETGEKVLYISPGFLKSIVELSTRESRVLLELLWEHAVSSEFTVRFKWEPGSLAFWDNRSTAHVAPQDIFALEFDRQLYRTTLVGEVPGVPTAAPALPYRAIRCCRARRSVLIEMSCPAGMA
jgi:taurine dioxygenase